MEEINFKKCITFPASKLKTISETLNESACFLKKNPETVNK